MPLSVLGPSKPLMPTVNVGEVGREGGSGVVLIRRAVDVVITEEYHFG